MHSELASVFDHVDRERDKSVLRLLDYLRHPSISAHNIGIQDVADRLVVMLTAMGLETTTMPTAGHPMVVARWSGAPGRPTVLLYGHYDVQPPDPLEAWTTPPYEPTIRDGRIFARGVADNKGQHLAQILAIEAHLKVSLPGMDKAAAMELVETAHTVCPYSKATRNDIDVRPRKTAI